MKLEKKGFIRLRADDKDKRKQRIILTEHCRQFCEKNDEAGAAVMNRMFEGISGDELSATIRTMIKMEKNLEGIEQ